MSEPSHALINGILGVIIVVTLYFALGWFGAGIIVTIASAVWITLIAIGDGGE